jgi:hypothetical protein
MKTHVDSTLFCLVVKRKFILIIKSMAKHVDSYFNQQLEMKKVGSSWSTITTFFGSTILVNMVMNDNKGFLKTL